MSKSELNLHLNKVCGAWRRNPKGDFGIEIEIEGGPWPAEPITNWSTHEDHSLRAHPKTGHPGMEYVISQPISVDAVPKAVDTLRAALANSLVDFTHRTSVHVHINVQRLTVRQWVSFVTLSLIFEEALVDIVGPSRVGNKFCLRGIDAEGAIQDLAAAIRSNQISRFMVNGHGAAYKYGAMNLHATPMHGTLEFRSMEGNLDSRRIHEWCKVIYALREAVKNYEDPRSICEAFSHLGPTAFASAVLPDGDIKAALLKDDKVDDKLWRGVRLAQDIVYASKWEGKVTVEAHDPALDEDPRVPGEVQWMPDAHPALRAAPAFRFQANPPRRRRPVIDPAGNLEEDF